MGQLGVYRSIPGDGVYRLPFPPYCESMAGALMGFTKRLHAAVGGFNPHIPIEDDEFSHPRPSRRLPHRAGA